MLGIDFWAPQKVYKFGLYRDPKLTDRMRMKPIPIDFTRFFVSAYGVSLSIVKQGNNKIRLYNAALLSFQLFTDQQCWLLY
jgi:hypothetical protein